MKKTIFSLMLTTAFAGANQVDHAFVKSYLLHNYSCSNIKSCYEKKGFLNLQGKNFSIEKFENDFQNHPGIDELKQKIIAKNKNAIDTMQEIQSDYQSTIDSLQESLEKENYEKLKMWEKAGTSVLLVEFIIGSFTELGFISVLIGTCIIPNYWKIKECENGMKRLEEMKEINKMLQSLAKHYSE